MKYYCTVLLLLALQGGYVVAQESTTYAFDVRTRDNFITFPVSDPTSLDFSIAKNVAPFAIDFNTAGDTLYAFDNNTLAFGTLDQMTGAFTSIVQSTGYGGGTSTGLSVDPTDETIYLSSATSLYTLDINSGVLTLIGDFSAAVGAIGTVIDIAIDNSGQMYAHELTEGSLWSVDKTNAVCSLIGSSGLVSSFAQGMDFNPDTDVLYAAIYTGGGTGSYGTWDTTTGQFTEILDLPSFDRPVELEVAITGGTTYAYNFRGDDGLITFPVDMPVPFTSDSIVASYQTFALDFAADGQTLHIYDNNSATIGTVDTTTGCYTPVADVTGDIGVDIAGGLACDPTTDTFYYLSLNNLGMIDVNTGVTTFVAPITNEGVPLTTALVDIAIDNSGRLFAFEIGDPTAFPLVPPALYEVDKVTGEGTVVGNPVTLNPPGFAQGMDFDPATDTLYQAIYTGGGTGSYGFWDLDTGTFNEILPLEAFEDPVGTGYELEMAIGLASKGCGFDLGDVNQDGVVSLLDVNPFVALLTSGGFLCEADINEDGSVTLLDVDPFVQLLSGG